MTAPMNEHTEGNRLKNPPTIFSLGGQSKPPYLQCNASHSITRNSNNERRDWADISDTKVYISDNCCRLGAEIIEALECKNRWMKAGIWLARGRQRGGTASSISLVI